MSQKRVVIVGSGISGLLATKYSLQNGLLPVVFEKTSEIGGLWTANGTAIWKGMRTNVSKYVSTLSDHPWPPGTPVYPTAEQVCNYFRSYAEKFSLIEHIRFRHRVEYVKRLTDDVGGVSWEVRYKNLDTGEVKTEIFDFFIFASGIYSKPRIPDDKNKSSFNGTIKHSSQFMIDDPDLKSKKVLIVGGCISAIDLAGIVSEHAESLTHVFRRPFAVVPRIRAEKIAEPNLYTILPLEFFSNRRSRAYEDTSLTRVRPQNRSGLKKLAPFQADKNPKCPEALWIDADDSDREIITAFSDTYIDRVRDGKIHPVRSEVDRFDENGVYLKNGEYVPTDVVIYCTGYHLSVNYLDEEIIDAIGFRSDKPKFTMLLFRNTFVPGWDNMAVIGQYARLYFVGYELQAMWATAVFTGKLKLPERSIMDEFVRELDEKRERDKGAQFPYGTYFKLVDDMARELGILPDLEAVREKNPEVFEYLWNDEVLWSHYLFDKRDNEYFMSMFREVHEYTTRVYEINTNEENIRQKDVQDLFEKFYK